MASSPSRRVTPELVRPARPVLTPTQNIQANEAAWLALGATRSSPDAGWVVPAVDEAVLSGNASFDAEPSPSGE